MAVARDTEATAALIWAACRPDPSRAAIAAALTAGADLGRVADVALAQRVAPLLWRALDIGGFTERFGPEVAGVEADAARCRAHAQLVVPRFADRALAPLADAGLEPLVIKGAALAARYPAPGLRPMDDVDLVMPRDRVDAALAVLRGAGWRTAPVPGRHHETVLVHPQVPGLPLELHRSLSTWPDRSNRLDPSVLWARREPCVVAGVPAFGLQLEDELVVLAAHAGKPFHVFERLIWSVDIAVAIGDAAARGVAIDWDTVLDNARRARARTALAVALVHAARLGATSPAELRRLPATGARRAALEPLCSPQWPLVVRDQGVRNRLRYALVDDPWLRVRLLATGVRREGPIGTARNAAGLAVRALRRWRQLRGVRRTPRERGRAMTASAAAAAASSARTG